MGTHQEESMLYGKWWGQKLWTVVPAGAVAGQYLQTFVDYPPSQVGGSFGIEQILKKVEDSLQSRTN
jgi:hypothetical protein